MSYDKGLRNADIWSYNGLQATLCGPFQEWPSKAHPASGASDRSFPTVNAAVLHDARLVEAVDSEPSMQGELHI